MAITQEQALAAFQAMYPDHAEKLKAERTHSIGYDYGNMNEFRLWDCFGTLKLIASCVSWEHALVLAEAARLAQGPADNSPIEEEIEEEEAVR